MFMTQECSAVDKCIVSGFEFEFQIHKAFVAWDSTVVQSSVQASTATHFLHLKRVANVICNQPPRQAHVCISGATESWAHCTQLSQQSAAVKILHQQWQHELPAVWKPWPWMVPVQEPDLGSHTLRVASPSPPPVTMVLPSGVKRPQRTAPVWP